jgi:23S rRNA-/tRNA-specific pseudouridylate synthase
MKAFREKKIEKYYLAFIEGIPKEDQFTVDQRIGLIPYAECALKKSLWAASDSVRV